MKSRTTERFRKALARLPAEVQEQARHVFGIWRKSPYHPSLQFKRIHSQDPIYSVRIGIHWRALAVLRDDRAIWFWIGHHSEYNQIVARL